MNNTTLTAAVSLPSNPFAETADLIASIDDALRQGVAALISDLADATLKPAMRLRIVRALLDLRKQFLTNQPSPAAGTDRARDAESTQIPADRDRPTPAVIAETSLDAAQAGVPDAMANASSPIHAADRISNTTRGGDAAARNRSTDRRIQSPSEVQVGGAGLLSRT